MVQKNLIACMGQKVPFCQFLRNWLIGWIGHALLVQSSFSAHRKWPVMVVSASNNQVWTKITIRSYAWSFSHSDPDPSSVNSRSIILIFLLTFTGICNSLRVAFWCYSKKVELFELYFLRKIAIQILHFFGISVCKK